MPILFDYFTLKIIWWLLVGALLIGFAVTDGFDLGVGALLPFVAKTDDERRVLINSIGPTPARRAATARASEPHSASTTYWSCPAASQRDASTTCPES